MQTGELASSPAGVPGLKGDGENFVTAGAAATFCTPNFSSPASGQSSLRKWEQDKELGSTGQFLVYVI